MATKKAPKEVKPKPAEKEEIVAVPLEELELLQWDAKFFNTSCTEIANLNALISALEAEKKELVELVKGVSDLLELPPKILGETFTYSFTTGETKTIQAHLLMQLGVSDKIIEKATKVTQSKRLTISLRKL